MNDKAKASEIAKILTLTAENFGAELSEARFQMLISELSRLSLDAVRHGMIKIIRTRKYSGFPTLGEILEACGAGPEDELDGIEAEAERQWALALDYQPPAAPHHRVIKGWLKDKNGDLAVNDKGGCIPVYEDPVPSGMSPEGLAALEAIGGIGPEAQRRFAHKDFLDTFRRITAGGARPAIAGQTPPKALAMVARIGSEARAADKRPQTDAEPSQAGPRLVRDQGKVA